MLRRGKSWKTVEELREINKRQARQLTEELAAKGQLERRVEKLSDAKATAKRAAPGRERKPSSDWPKR